MPHLTSAPRAVPLGTAPPDPAGDRPGPTITAFGCDPGEAALLHELAPRFGTRVVTLTEPPTAATAVLARAGRYVSVGHQVRVTGPTLRALSEVGVRHLSTRSIGCDHIDVDAAAAAGIAVATVPYPPDGVADFTLMLVLMALRGARSIVQRVDRHDYRLAETRGRDLRDLTVGVVGSGRIGTAVLQRLTGFGCRVLTHDTGGGASLPLDTVLLESDVLTMHVPLTASTHRLLDADRIARMKRGAVLVNTARGGLVDTAALVAALEEGRLGGAALDVVEDEEGVFTAHDRDGGPPPDLLRRLQALPQVVITPHTAYYTEHTLRAVVTGTLARCQSDEREWS